MVESLLGLPELASAHGAEVDRLLGLVHLLMLVVFVGWASLFTFLLLRFRRSRQPRASYSGLRARFSNWAEGAIVLAEAALLFGLAIPLWSERTDRQPPEDEAFVVRVVAQQFAWNVHYPGPDGLFGRADLALVDEETNPLGLDQDDPLGQDDVTVLNQLHLPVNRPVIVHLTSKDVIHGFAIPAMRVKQDAIPGLSVPVWWTPTVTTDEMRRRTGDPAYTYEIACAQLCGNSHYSMKGYVTVETAEELEAWLAALLEHKRAYAEDAAGEQDDFWN